ncbi:MAG: hypothetical protein ACFFC0_08545, partial [Promethearchaeota archaeon]
MKRLALLISVTLLLTAMISTGGHPAASYNLGSYANAATEGLVTGVPYVWQEINGLCAWAATSIAFQSAGVPLDLHDVLAVTSVGYSFAYLNYNDTMVMYPGPIYMQAEPTQFAADLYGLNMTVYMDIATPGVEQLVEVWEGRGISVHLLDGED